LLPKFHSELNPIERWWAQLKAFCRRNCHFNIGKLEETMLAAVNDSIGNPDYFKRIFQTSLRYMLLYTTGLDDQEATKMAKWIPPEQKAEGVFSSSCKFFIFPQSHQEHAEQQQRSAALGLKPSKKRVGICC
jgi:hypothetical protein